jgi:hypothetical protein
VGPHPGCSEEVAPWPGRTRVRRRPRSS